jgi:hypothetical protein
LTRNQIIAAALAATAACGATAALASNAHHPKTAADEVRAAQHSFHRAVLKGDQRACDVMLPAARSEFTGNLGLLADDCDLAVLEIGQAATPDERHAIMKIKINRVRINGDRAVIRDEDVTLAPGVRPDGNDTPTIWRKTSDGWRLEQLG